MPEGFEELMPFQFSVYASQVSLPFCCKSKYLSKMNVEREVRVAISTNGRQILGNVDSKEAKPSSQMYYFKSEVFSLFSTKQVDFIQF